MKIITESEYETLVTAEKPLVVDFFADWCGPCKAVAPAFEKVASELAEHAEFVKVNIDESENLPPKLGIRGIPTFVVLKGGKEVARTSGSKSYNDLLSWVQSAVDK